MRPYKTIAQILIATSVAGSAFAAPAAAEETHDARADLSELERRWELGSTTKGILKTAPIAGLVAGTIGGLAVVAQKFIAAAVPSYNSNSSSRRRSSEDGTDFISRGFAGLSDDDLRMLSLLTRSAIGDLD